MANKKSSGTNLDTDKLNAVIDTLKKVKAGEEGEAFPTGVGDPLIEDLLTHVNDVVEALQRSSQDMHDATMDLALGLSDCFEALNQVRSGNFEAQVSSETLDSSDELLARFAQLLNLTLEDIKDTIERQQFAIRTLSTPILQLWDDVLALPVIGVVDTQRSAEIMEKLLAAIVDHQSRYVILDITGVEIVDTKTADHFIKLINSAQLLGAQCILTGIQPAVAQTLVDIGIDLSSITTLRNLQAGLAECLRRKEVRRRSQRMLAKHGEQPS